MRLIKTLTGQGKGKPLPYISLINSASASCHGRKVMPACCPLILCNSPYGGGVEARLNSLLKIGVFSASIPASFKISLANCQFSHSKAQFLTILSPASLSFSLASLTNSTNLTPINYSTKNFLPLSIAETLTKTPTTIHLTFTFFSNKANSTSIKYPLFSPQPSKQTTTYYYFERLRSSKRASQSSSSYHSFSLRERGSISL